MQINYLLFAASFIKHLEGFREEPYSDTGGKLTVGYGHLLRAYEENRKYTEKECRDFLKMDVENVDAHLKVHVKYYDILKYYRKTALLSFAYNIGLEAFKFSRLLTFLNKQQYDFVPEEIRRWVYVHENLCEGLKNRREQEIKMWEGYYAY